MAQPAIEAALLRHDRVRKSTDLPLFYGSKDKDTVDPQDFLDRFETASEIAQWVPAPAAGQPANEAQKCQQFYLLLRGKALHWWRSLDDVPNLDKASWQQLKPHFISHYIPRYTARTACMSFADLTQHHGELVADYALRVSQAYCLLKDCRPPGLFDVAQAIPVIPGLDAAGLQVANPLIEAYGAACKLEGISDMGIYVQQSIFTAGLSEEIRIKTMDARPATLVEAKNQAMSFETVIRDKRGSKPLISAIEKAAQLDSDNEADNDEEDEELLDQVNAIRRQRGKKPIRFAQSSRPKVTVTCRYCKKTGHFQRECFKRKKDNGAMVDAQGKPLKFNSIENEQEEEETYQDEEEDGAVQSISRSLAQSFYGIYSIREDTSEPEEPTKVQQNPAALVDDKVFNTITSMISRVKKDSSRMLDFLDVNNMKEAVEGEYDPRSIGMVKKWDEDGRVCRFYEVHLAGPIKLPTPLIDRASTPVDESEIYIAPFADHSLSESEDEEIEWTPKPDPPLWTDHRQKLLDDFQSLDRHDQEWNIEWSALLPLIGLEMPDFWRHYGFRSPAFDNLYQALRPMHPIEFMIPLIEGYRKRFQQDPTPLLDEISHRKYLPFEIRSNLALRVINQLHNSEVRQRVLRDIDYIKMLTPRDLARIILAHKNEPPLWYEWALNNTGTRLSIDVTNMIDRLNRLPPIEKIQFAVNTVHACPPHLNKEELIRLLATQGLFTLHKENIAAVPPPESLNSQ
jgi:Retrotransposon gag protein/Zinc knuckle